MKLPTREMGEIEIVWSQGWGEWGPLRETVFGGLVSVVPEEAVHHALHRWSKPLVTALGIPPYGALIKIPRVCYRKVKHDTAAPCILYDPQRCHARSKELPWCFEPDVDDAEVRRKGGELVQLWHEGVYLVVTLETDDVGNRRPF